MMLANLSHAVTASQLSVVLLDSNASVTTAGSLASVYAGGVIAGRLLCGLALDRFKPNIVAFVAHLLPATGMFLLGSSLDHTGILSLAMLLLGVAIGAEGDIAGYLIVRIFGVKIYSNMFGLNGAGVGLATAIGSVLLSRSIQPTGSFAFFLNANGFAILLSTALFLVLGCYIPRAAPRENRTASEWRSIARAMIGGRALRRRHKAPGPRYTLRALARE